MVLRKKNLYFQFGERGAKPNGVRFCSLRLDIIHYYADNFNKMSN